MPIQYLRTGVGLLRDDPRRVLRALTEPSRSVDILRRKAQYVELERFTEDGLALNSSFSDAKDNLDTITDDDLETVAEQSRTVFYEYDDGNREPLDALLSDRTYVFVTGAPRTGGAYTTTKLRQTLCDYRNGDNVVADESLPDFEHLHNLDDASHERQAVFELIQWLVWIDRYYPDHEFVVKKCSGLPPAMGLIDEFFDKTTFHVVLTTRHPSAIYRSDLESGKGIVPPHLILSDFDVDTNENIPQWWRETPWNVKILCYWQQLYNSFIQALPAHRRDDLSVVRYGDQDTTAKELLNRIAPAKVDELTKSIEDDPFYLTEREYDDFWESPLVRAVIRDVQATWEAEGLDFPVEHGDLMH